MVGCAGRNLMCAQELDQNEAGKGSKDKTTESLQGTAMVKRSDFANSVDDGSVCR